MMSRCFFFLSVPTVIVRPLMLGLIEVPFIHRFGLQLDFLGVCAMSQQSRHREQDSSNGCCQPNGLLSAVMRMLSLLTQFFRGHLRRSLKSCCGLGECSGPVRIILRPCSVALEKFQATVRLEMIGHIIVFEHAD